MRCIAAIAVAGLAFALDAAVARQAMAGNLEALRATDNYRDAVFSTAQATKAWVDDRCDDARAAMRDHVGVVAMPEVDDTGAPQAGTWIEHIRVAGCGRQRQLNVLVAVHGLGSVAMSPLLPGSTHADPTLQKDGVAYAFTAAASAGTGCPSMYVAETRYLDVLADPPIVPGKPGWSERWTIAHCATKTDVTLRFVPDATGTSVSVARDQP